MATLKDRLTADLTTAIKQRNELVTATLRLALAAIRTEEVAGKSARELSDAEELAVLNREAKKRREAADAFAGAGRAELAERERSEGAVIERYLPAPLTDEELTDVVRQAIAETGATEPRQLGAVMKVASAKVAGRAPGGRVAEEARRQLTG